MPSVDMIEIQLEASLAIMPDREVVYRCSQRQAEQSHHLLRHLPIAQVGRRLEGLFPNHRRRRVPRARRCGDADHGIQDEIQKYEQAGVGVNAKDQLSTVSIVPAGVHARNGHVIVWGRFS